MELQEKLKQYTLYSQGIKSEVKNLYMKNELIKDFNFTQYDLNNSVFLETDFENCDFGLVYLSGSNFGGSRFSNCIFRDNTINKAEWNGIQMFKTQLIGVKCFRTTFFHNQIHNIEIIQCKFLRASFSDSIIKNCTFVNSIFDNCICERIKFENTKFKQCVFKDVDFERKGGLEFIECEFVTDM